MGVPLTVSAGVAVGLGGLALSGPALGGVAADPVACSAGRGPVDVRISPQEGPVGTRVRVSGRCFSRRWNSGYGIFLMRQFSKPRECEIIAGGRFRFRVDRTGRGRGWFEVAHDGACFQHRYRRRVRPGHYQVGVGCHACAIARFRVIRQQR